MKWLQQTIEKQRAALSEKLGQPMAGLAQSCAAAWDERNVLESALTEGLREMPLCHLVYATNTDGVQVSPNITQAGPDQRLYGQDLSRRPFLASAVPCDGFLLSEVYVSEITHRPCITAVQVVAGEKKVLGFIAADFDLRNLSLPESGSRAEETAWRQIKGDPAIRSTVFMQRREQSPMDRHAEDMIAIINELICERGVFHAKLHYSSSRATLWLYDDPYHYQIHVLDEIIDPSVCLAYPRRPYPAEATVAPDKVWIVFERFRQLREADETVYLRAGSLNVINGMVSLTFSCDGAHYMSAAEFLEKGDEFWFGAPTQKIN